MWQLHFITLCSYIILLLLGSSFTASFMAEKKRARSATSEPRFFCDVNDCTFETNSSRNLKTHKLTHSAALFHCDVTGCSFETIHSSSFTRHKKNHTTICKCDFPGCSFETNTALKLKRHISNHSKEPVIFKCSVCDTPFKTLQYLKRHEKTASHKRKVDLEFAAAEEAEKAAKKAARDTKETDRLRKRRRTEAEKQSASLKNQETLRAKLAKRNKAPPIIETGTEEDVLSALVRYHGSTSAAMLLHDDDEKIKSNIKKFINVSSEAKSEIRKAWQKSEMALNTPYLSCASCGIRNHGNYAEIEVATLPDFFKFKAKHQFMYDILKGEVSLCCLL